VVVDAEDRLALDATEQIRHLLVLLKPERNAVPFSLPVWWIQVEQCGWSIVFGDAGLPIEMLDGDPGKAEMGGTEILFDP
jgi:hypothetical protein